MTRDPGEVFEANYESGVSGLVGSIEVAIHDNQSTVVFGPTAAGISEFVVDGQPTGRYTVMLTAPATEGDYTIHWSDDGSFSPDGGGGFDELRVEDTTLDLPSLGGETGAVLCNVWTTAEQVAECCDADIFDSGGVLADAAIVAASEILYLASGSQYPGLCSATVRPCRTDTCGCGFQVLSRGHLVGWQEDCWGGYDCGCRAVSRIKLPGYVNEITQVKIDGAVVDPSGYFVYENEYLVRKNGLRWPRCQSMDLDDTESGTFSVTYTYGKAPPVAGQLAAKDLACEISKACTPGVECAIPNGLVRVTRQGITYERALFARNPDGIWQTGIFSVDFFLNAVNPHGIQRRATVWSASQRARYARPAPQ